jgi:basic amino acid/polyamine antiporter, APA family
MRMLSVVLSRYSTIMPNPMPPGQPVTVAPKRVLTLFDSTCIIVGIILGAGIYQNAPMIARGAESGWGVIALWLAGGLLSLCGALGYAELASAYPREGGDYVYLSRAYGRWAGNTCYREVELAE